MKKPVKPTVPTQQFILNTVFVRIYVDALGLDIYKYGCKFSEIQHLKFTCHIEFINNGITLYTRDLRSDHLYELYYGPRESSYLFLAGPNPSRLVLQKSINMEYLISPLYYPNVCKHPSNIIQPSLLEVKFYNLYEAHAKELSEKYQNDLIIFNSQMMQYEQNINKYDRWKEQNNQKLRKKSLNQRILKLEAKLQALKEEKSKEL